MKIKQIYSHLNGYEFIRFHKEALWIEIENAINSVDASKAFDKISKEKTMVGRVLYSPSGLNNLIKAEFTRQGWTEKRISYYVNEDLSTTRSSVDIIDREKQKCNRLWRYANRTSCGFSFQSLFLLPQECLRKGKAAKTLPPIAR